MVCLIKTKMKYWLKNRKQLDCEGAVRRQPPTSTWKSSSCSSTSLRLFPSARDKLQMVWTSGVIKVAEEKIKPRQSLILHLQGLRLNHAPGALTAEHPRQVGATCSAQMIQLYLRWHICCWIWIKPQPQTSQSACPYCKPSHREAPSY